MADGGIIALHDSCSECYSPDRRRGSAIFTREVIRKNQRFRVAEVVDTLTVLCRREPDASFGLNGV